MGLVFKLLYGIVGVVASLFAILFIAGQLGMLRGTPPVNLGVKDGKLKPPAKTPNSVSSQANLYPDHPQREYASIEPLAYTGDAAAAVERLASLIGNTGGCSIVQREGGYLYAQCSTRWLRFTDDLELWVDEASRVIQVRSSSRIGRKDFGVNRARVEALRAAFKA